MKKDIFDILINFINKQDSNVVIFHYSEIINLCGEEFKNEIFSPENFNDYVKLAQKKFIEENYYWDNDVNNKIIVFKKLK